MRMARESVFVREYEASFAKSIAGRPAACLLLCVIAGTYDAFFQLQLQWAIRSGALSNDCFGKAL